MAEIRKRVLSFSNGKQIKLYGNSIAISKSMEIGEGFSPNVFSLIPGTESEKSVGIVFNPHKLSAEEFQELADYNIRLWMDFKESIRKHGLNSPKIFNREAMV